MKQTFFVVALFWATISYAEISAFNAGNINSNSTYGLTPNEKILKDRLDELNSNYLQINSTLDSTNERVEGLQSTFEGINSQYNESNTKFTQLEQQLITMDEEVKKLSASVRTIRSENKQIKQALSELTQLMSAYISKDIMDTNSTKSPKDTNATALPNSQKEEAWKKQDSAIILDSALKDFQKDDSLQNAKEKFEELVSRKYKPARSNFYLGEIEYKQKNYSGAIVLYQKSVALYSKDTDYMAKLLYHTAISFDKVGDTQRANGFYQVLKTQYPESAEAKASPNRK